MLSYATFVRHHFSFSIAPPHFFSVDGDTDRICDRLDLDIQNTEHNKVSAVGESFQSSVNSFSSVNTVSAVIDATTVDSKHQTPPTAPRNVRLNSLSRIGNTSRFRYNISWNHPSSSGSSDLDRYEAEINFRGRWDRITAVTGTGRGISAATSGGYGIPHRFRVRAYNEGDEVSPWSSEVMFTTWNSPTSPSLTATAGGSDNIVLTWTVPDPRGRPITGYKIQVSENGTSGWTDLIETTDPTLTTHTHESLPPGTTRYYSIFAINSIGLSDRSIVVSSTTDAVAPNAPTSLSATADGHTAINLSWTAPISTGGAAINGYKIEVSPNGNSNWTNQVLNTGNANVSYSHTGLTASTTRHYRVSAINSAGTGPASNTANATTDAATAPGAPTSLSATADGQTAIDLSWTAPTSTGGAAITGYKIEVSSNNGNSFSDLLANTGTAAITYSHTGLNASTTRHYRVSAINSAGTGPSSDVANATTDAATAPGAPTSLSATADGQTAIDLSWTAPTSTGGTAITGYKIEVSTNNGSSFSDLVANTGSAATTYSHTGLTASTTRHYRVSAINSVGTGPPSDVANATTVAPAATAPSAPTELTASASGPTRINLRWTVPSSTGGADINGYNIQISTDGGTTFSDLVSTTGSTSTTYAHTGLDALTTRHYRVRAINSVDTGPASNVATATTSEATAPSAPSSLTATADGQTIINLSWTAPTNTGGVAITAYRIEVSADGGSSFSNLVANTGDATTTYAHTGVSAETTRHYRVSAINSAGTGAVSNVANATTAAATPPGAPTSLIATASGRTIINLSWTPPSENGGATITGFQIEVSTDGTSGWSDLVSNTGSAATIYAHTALDPSSTRFYRVRAINSAGTSDASTTASATTEAVSAPDAPTGLTATLSQNNAVILSWTAPADDGGSPITGYQIDQSPDGITDWTNLIANTGSAATTYILTNLAPDSPRFFRVTAINAIGDSAPSDVVNRPSPNPLSLSMTIVDQFYPLGLLIQDLVLSEALGGTLPFTYTLTPTLPEGLILNNSSHTISGTPTKTMPQTTYTWEVKDADGNTADQEFDMEVYEMSFTQTVSNQSYSRGEPIPMLVLPEATGGKDPIQYILNLLSLPTGLRYDLSTRIINGTPLTVTVPTPMSYKAVDAHGAEDSLKFTIEVVSPVHSEVEKGLPQHFKVKSNYPNPFHHSTNLVFDLPWPARVQIEVMDVTGRRLVSIPSVYLTAGWGNEIELSDLNLPSGPYLFRIQATSLDDRSSSVYVGNFMSVR